MPVFVVLLAFLCLLLAASLEGSCLAQCPARHPLHESPGSADLLACPWEHEWPFSCAEHCIVLSKACYSGELAIRAVPSSAMIEVSLSGGALPCACFVLQYNAKEGTVKIVFEPQPTPRKIQALAGKTIVKMACGNNHSGGGQRHDLWPCAAWEQRHLEGSVARGQALRLFLGPCF